MGTYRKNWASALLLSTSFLLTSNLVLDSSNGIAKALETDDVQTNTQQTNNTDNKVSTKDTTNTANVADTKTGNNDGEVNQQPINTDNTTVDNNDTSTGNTEITEPTNKDESTNPETEDKDTTKPEKENPNTKPTTPKKEVENPQQNPDKNVDKKPVKDVIKDKDTKKSQKKAKAKAKTKVKKQKLTKAEKKKLAIKKKEQKKLAITNKQTKLLKIDAKANKKLLEELKKNPSISTNIDTGDYINLTNWAYFDVRSQSNGDVTAERMNKVAKVMGKTTKMRNANIGDMIMKASKKYNINAGIIFAMTMYETGWGSSNQFVNLNNTGGMECMTGYACEGRWTKFDSLEDSIDRKAKLLAGHLYVGSGRVTLYDIISRYAPSFENNVNQYVNDIGRINEVYLGQKPLTIKGTKLMTEVNADAVLQNKGASAYEIKEALKQIELAKAERDTIDEKIKEQKEEQQKLKEKIKKEKERAKKLQALKDKQEMLKVRDANVENSIDIYQKGQLDEILK